jgi:DNA-binding MarR family transcriptional regulator
MDVSEKTELAATGVDVAAEVNAIRAIARLARFAERGLGELSLAQYRILAAIAAGDQRASRVAAKFFLGKPTVSGTVEALRRKGLITKSTAGNDQRVSALVLTDRGREVLTQAEGELVVALRELIGDGGYPDVIETLTGLGAALEAQAQEKNRILPHPDVPA